LLWSAVSLRLLLMGSSGSGAVRRGTPDGPTPRGTGQGSRNCKDLPPDPEQDGDRAIDLNVHPAIAKQFQVGATTLDLRRAGIRDDDLTGLESWDALGAVTRIDLSDNDLTDAGVDRIASCQRLRALRALILDFNELTDASAEVLSRSQHLAGLRELSLCTNDLGDRGATSLAGSDVLRSLEVLCVGHCKVGGAGVHALIASRLLSNIRELDIRGAPVDAAVLKAMTASSFLGKLEHLDFSDNSLGPDAVGDEDLGMLIDAESSLPNLRTVLFLPRRIWGDSGALDVVHRRAGRKP
jgi:hypothetical protein